MTHIQTEQEREYNFDEYCPECDTMVPIVIDDDDATGIEGNRAVADEADEQWFDLQGRRLEQKPTKKGIYILNGRKVVVK